ncbi:helix-turn-helix domain-containing protein [Aeromicrobium sp. Leaf350]|uniref:helix-turn-helix domain-containing protein n=1 Tax=Aeromicrobium sp. Leaf350 TaxID=2876565 RepID=UPI001E6114A0|nr:helix-turn-helix domain-containing protein [Aeromicrobium sp. Leaf350]
MRGHDAAALFRDLGLLEARAGHDLDAMRAAHQIATQEAWTEFRDAATELDLGQDVVGQLAQTLLAFQEQLLQQASLGFSAGDRPRHPDPRPALLTAVVGGESPRRLALLSRAAAWPIPEQLVVAVSLPTERARAIAQAHPMALSGTDGRHLLVAAEPEVAAHVAAALGSGGAVVAVSGRVTTADAHHASRWALRLLRLALDEKIPVPADGVVHVDQHQLDLSLHADPVLRERIDHEMLAPLTLETAKRRAILGETMMVWLQTGDSAAALADRLGVHHQTAYGRLRKLRFMFRDRLDDPKQAAALLTALESAMPRWRRELD